MGILEILLGIWCIGVGLAYLFAKDWVWAWRATRYRVVDSIRAERTADWDDDQNVSGVIAIIFGLVCLYVGYNALIAPTVSRESLPSYEEIQQTITATARAIAPER